MISAPSENSLGLFRMFLESGNDRYQGAIGNLEWASSTKEHIGQNISLSFFMNDI